MSMTKRNTAATSEIKDTLLMWSITAGILLILLCPSALFSQVKQFNFLYLHSFFSGKHWKITSDTISYNLSSSFLSKNFSTGSMAGSSNINIAAFATGDNSLYLSRIEAKEPGGIYGSWELSVSEPALSPAASGSNRFEIFSLSFENTDTVILAEAASNNTLALHRILGSDFTLISSDSITLSLPDPSTEILTLNGAPLHTGENSQGIWLTGTDGMIRFFSPGVSLWNETVYDITQTESVTALHPDYAGTASGKIYRREEESFILDTSVSSNAVWAVSPYGAAGDNGLIAKKFSTGWKEFSIENNRYSHFNLIARSDGSGAELLDSSWQYSIVTLEDNPTSFTVTPDSVADYINNGIYYTSAESETLSIRLFDPDGNHNLPNINLTYISTKNLFFDSTSQTLLHSAHPDTECVTGYAELADSVITLILTSEEVILSAPARKGIYDPMGGGCEWSDITFSTSYQWNNGFYVTIDLGGRILQINKRETVIKENTLIGKKTVLNPKAFQVSDGIRFSIPTNSSLSGIRLFNIHGQLIKNINLNNKHSSVFTRPLNLPSGLLFVVYEFSSGKLIRDKLHIIK